MGKKEPVAFLSLSSWCLLMVVWLFPPVPWVCLQFVIMVFPDHTHLLFLRYSSLMKSNVMDYTWVTEDAVIPKYSDTQKSVRYGCCCLCNEITISSSRQVNDVAV